MTIGFGRRSGRAQMHRACQWGLSGLAVLLVGRPASALVIVPTFSPNVTSLSNASVVENAINYVDQQYENLFSDNITVNITIASTSTAGALGGSQAVSEFPETYSQIRSHLISDAKSSADTTAVASLPATDPSGGNTYVMYGPEARAIGLAGSTTSDGTFTFGTNPSSQLAAYPNNYTFDPANRQVSGEIDFIGVAEHEVSELLGRVFGLGQPGRNYQAFDLFRYTASNARGMTAGNNIYFSVDGGVTNLKNYNYPAGSSNASSDPQDWASGTNDAYNAFSGPSTQNNVTPVDVTAMDAIGYDVANLVWTGGSDHTSWNIFSAANWKNSSVSSVTYTDAALVVFDDTSSGGNSVTLNQTVYPTSVTVNSSVNNYNISGSGSIAGFGSLAKSGTSTLTLSTANTYTGNTTISQGTLTITGSGSIGGSATVTVAANAVLNANSNGALSSASVLNANGTVNFGANTGGGILARRLGTLNIASTGSVTITAAPSHGTRTVLVTPILAFAGGTNTWAGRLDLSSNDLIVQGGSLANVTNQLKLGFNAGSGYWNGSGGIISTAAANDTNFLTTLGLGFGGPSFNSNPGSPFDGVNTASTDVLVKYTYYGDATLDGSVNGEDYQQIDLGFGSHLTGWSNGDFNYDGVVDGSDYSLIDNTFNQINATGASPLALVSADGISSAVPEPTMIGSLGVGACVLLLRRRRGPSLRS
jgi:autotransporter-associated beta strand protein